MSKSLLIAIAIIFFTFFPFANPSFAQSPQVNEPSDNHTAREEAEGKEIWEKLQAKQLDCKDLTDENYDSLGEYFMGQSIGDTQRHALMNQMMISMMGEEGEQDMHIVMGKRLSGCNTSVQLPQNGAGLMPMMWMMGSAGSPQVGGGNPMMGYGWNPMMGGWNGFGIFGWLSMILFWALLILGVIALFRYLGRSSQQPGHKTPFEILKERYAKGEIDKKEFEAKKRDLV